MTQIAEVTIADILIYARNELVTAMEKGDENRIEEIVTFLNIVYETAEKHFQGVPMKVIGFVDDMLDSVRDFHNGETWKSELPSVEDIHLALDI